MILNALIAVLSAVVIGLAVALTRTPSSGQNEKIRWMIHLSNIQSDYETYTCYSQLDCQLSIVPDFSFGSPNETRFKYEIGTGRTIYQFGQQTSPGWTTQQKPLSPPRIMTMTISWCPFRCDEHINQCQKQYLESLHLFDGNVHQATIALGIRMRHQGGCP